jgi:hypothetical protein
MRSFLIFSPWSQHNEVGWIMISFAHRVSVLIALVLLLSGSIARAGTISFNFSSLTATGIESTDDPKVQSSMNAALGSSGSVTVTGAVLQTNYAGDGHVVGPKNSGTYVPWTLGDTGYNSNGGLIAPTAKNPIYSSFITNDGFNGGTTITMALKGLSISSISFDFEIFPDGTETKSNPADLTIIGLNGTTQVGSTTISAVNPGAAGVTAYLPSGTIAYTHSPNSTSGTEGSAQLLGSTVINFSSPVNVLEFQDWPALIGINNLTLVPPPVQHQIATPAPSSVLLLGLGGLGLVAYAIRSRRRAIAAA